MAERKIKNRKNCECCPGHYLFRNLSVIVNLVTKSLKRSQSKYKSKSLSLRSDRASVHITSLDLSAVAIAIANCHLLLLVLLLLLDRHDCFIGDPHVVGVHWKRRLSQPKMKK